MKIRKAIILAGGLGLRLRPMTEVFPKPLIEVNGKPIIQYAIENLTRQGVKDIVLSVGYLHEKVKGYFGDGSNFGCSITYSVEKERLGTGGAAKIATKDLKEPFIILNGDNLADFNFREMWKVHEAKKAEITLALFPVEDVTQYGIAKVVDSKIVRFVEKPSVEEAPSNLNNAGAYIIEPGALDILPEGPSSIERDCFEKIAREGKLYAYIHNGQWYPTDTLEKLAVAHKFMDLTGSI